MQGGEGWAGGAGWGAGGGGVSQAEGKDTLGPQSSAGNLHLLGPQAPIGLQRGPLSSRLGGGQNLVLATGLEN